MTINDIRFVPHSDMSINDKEIVSQHQNLINSNSFSDATAFLNNKNYQKGFRASLFNNMQDKIKILQEYLLTKEEEASEETISTTEPTNSSTLFWLADY